MQLLIFFFLISIVFSFLCSVWEAVLLSVTPSFVAAREKEGGLVGQLLARFKADIDRPLAAILTLNTIAHTVGAIGVGAQAARVWPQTQVAGISVSAVMVPTIMTLAILILSEIIPKTLGANYWRTLTGFTVSSLNVVIYALFPLVWLSQLITKVLKRNKQKSVLSRSEFAAMTEMIASKGVIQKKENRIIQNLLELDRVRAKDVMTPRTVVTAADQNQSVRQFYENAGEMRFTRVPTTEGGIDQVTGFVMRDDVLSALVAGAPETKLSEITRKIMVLPESSPLPAVFNSLLEQGQQIALVVDTYGGMAGILTMEDVLETLLGMEIVDEFDRAEDMQAFARKVWEKRARSMGLIREQTENSDKTDTDPTSTPADIEK